MSIIPSLIKITNKELDKLITEDKVLISLSNNDQDSNQSICGNFIIEMQCIENPSSEPKIVLSQNDLHTLKQNNKLIISSKKRSITIIVVKNTSNDLGNNAKNNRILDVKITNTNAFIKIIEKIYNILPTCSLIFKSATQNNDESGCMCIEELTSDKAIYIKLQIDATSFEYFHCRESNITICIDMEKFYALLKSVNSNYPIGFYMDDNTILYIDGISNSSKHACKIYTNGIYKGYSKEVHEITIKMPLLEPNKYSSPMPIVKYDRKICIAADDLHSICNELIKHSTLVNIVSTNDEIIFKTSNDSIRISCKNIQTNKTSNNTICGCYELYNLLPFSKCEDDNDIIEMNLLHEALLILVIDTPIGKMNIFLAPCD